MKSLTSLYLLGLIFLVLTVKAQDTLGSGNNWRLFPSKHQSEVDTNRLMQAQQLDFSKPEGKVTINQDTRIDAIGSQLKSEPYFYGYTLQLEVSQQKSAIKEARYKILKIKPDIELDDPYEAPNIYLYAGRFYDRISAYQFKKEISTYFPNAIVVGPRKMELPRMPEPEIKDFQQDSTSVPNGGLEVGTGQ